jgi:DNA primase
MYDFAQERCVFLIYDDNKNMIGAVGRALRKGVTPKWKRYDKRKDLMFFCGPKSGTAVLVEDCASACTVFASGFTGAALLGTSLNEHHVHQLRVFDKVIVALDADASKKAIRMQKMLAPHVTSEVLFLTDDLKYFTPECVKSLLTK